MPTALRACVWMATLGLVTPPIVCAQDRTEREVVDLIVRRGPQATAIRAEAEVARRTQLARLAYPNPGMTYSRESAGFTEFLQVEQMLPVFGARAALARAGVAANAVAEAERDARLWMLRADAAALAARMIAEQERLEVVQEQARDMERLIEILRTREREGEGSRFDRLRAEQELRDVRQLLTSVRAAVAGARAALAAMLPADVVVTRVTGPLYIPRSPIPVESLIARALATRAEVRALRHAAERTSLEAEAAQRARLPVPTVFGGLKRAGTDARREHGAVFGVNLSFPLFDAGAREAARWAAERARIEAERAALEQQLRTEVERASEALALRQAAVAQDAEGDSTELMQIAELAYREGEVGILELLDAVRTAARARLRRIDLRLDARLAQIAVERAVGDTLWP